VIHRFVRLEKADFCEFLRDYPIWKFSTRWKKPVFFTTAAPPTGDLWKIHYPTFVGHIFLSQTHSSPGKLNKGIFLQRAKREKNSHDKCPLADEIRKSGSATTPGLGQ
jgi:RNase P/RNase MRP subunit p30